MKLISLLFLFALIVLNAESKSIPKTEDTNNQTLANVNNDIHMRAKRDDNDDLDAHHEKNNNKQKKKDDCKDSKKIPSKEDEYLDYEENSESDYDNQGVEITTNQTSKEASNIKNNSNKQEMNTKESKNQEVVDTMSSNEESKKKQEQNSIKASSKVSTVTGSKQVSQPTTIVNTKQEEEATSEISSSQQSQSSIIKNSKFGTVNGSKPVFGQTSDEAAKQEEESGTSGEQSSSQQPHQPHSSSNGKTSSDVSLSANQKVTSNTNSNHKVNSNTNVINTNEQTSEESVTSDETNKLASQQEHNSVIKNSKFGTVNGSKPVFGQTSDEAAKQEEDDLDLIAKATFNNGFKSMNAANKKYNKLNNNIATGSLNNLNQNLFYTKASSSKLLGLDLVGQNILKNDLLVSSVLDKSANEIELENTRKAIELIQNYDKLKSIESKQKLLHLLNKLGSSKLNFLSEKYLNSTASLDSFDLDLIDQEILIILNLANKTKSENLISGNQIVFPKNLLNFIGRNSLKSVRNGKTENLSTLFNSKNTESAAFKSSSENLLKDDKTILNVKSNLQTESNQNNLKSKFTRSNLMDADLLASNALNRNFLIGTGNVINSNKQDSNSKTSSSLVDLDLIGQKSNKNDSEQFKGNIISGSSNTVSSVSSNPQSSKNSSSSLVGINLFKNESNDMGSQKSLFNSVKNEESESSMTPNQSESKSKSSFMSSSSSSISSTSSSSSNSSSFYNLNSSKLGSSNLFDNDLLGHENLLTA